MELVGEVPETAALVDAVDQSVARLVVFGTDHTELPQTCRDLLEHRPRVKILSIAADGQRISLYELCPHKVPLADVSSETLIQTIRDAATSSVWAW
jgi:hypothetical protein